MVFTISFNFMHRVTFGPCLGKNIARHVWDSSRNGFAKAGSDRDIRSKSLGLKVPKINFPIYHFTAQGRCLSRSFFPVPTQRVASLWRRIFCTPTCLSLYSSVMKFMKFCHYHGLGQTHPPIALQISHKRNKTQRRRAPR